MEINGLPAHPLAVHAAVVLGPLAALVSLLYVAVPPWRDHLRMPMLLLAVGAAFAVGAAYLTGLDFLEGRPELATSPVMAGHERAGERALWVVIAYTVLTVLAWVRHHTPGALRTTAQVLMAAGAAAALWAVFVSGESGARSVWGG